jgi:nitroreductase
MDLKQLITNRRTVHNYATTKVSDDLVRQALELSLWAPNHKQTWPWVYTWLGPKVRAELGEINVSLKSAKGPISEVKAKATRENVTTPSHLISLGIRRGADEFRQHEDFATLACSVQIACLFLQQHGIATKWSTGEWTFCAQAYKAMGLNPDEVKLEGCLMIGVPAVLPEPVMRPPLEKFLRTLD